MMHRNFIFNEEPDKIFEHSITIVTVYSCGQQYKLLTYTKVLQSKSNNFTNKYKSESNNCFSHNFQMPKMGMSNDKFG